MSPTGSHAVAPGNVRVWRGYPLSSLDLASFLALLGGTFIPGCALMQPPLGLWAYLPGVPAQAGLPANVPWETALLCWASPAAYANNQGTVGGRAYTLTHMGVYNLGPAASSSAYAQPFDGTLALETPVHLFPQAVDWMHGTARHLVAGFASGTNNSAFLSALAAWAQGVAAAPPAGLDSAFLCTGLGYVAWWEHWSGPAPGPSPTATLPAGLKNYLWQTAASTTLGASLDQTWPGLPLTGNQFLNIQFKRVKPANT